MSPTRRPKGPMPSRMKSRVTDFSNITFHPFPAFRLNFENRFGTSLSQVHDSSKSFLGQRQAFDVLGEVTRSTWLTNLLLQASMLSLFSNSGCLQGGPTSPAEVDFDGLREMSQGRILSTVTSTVERTEKVELQSGI